MLGQTLKWWKLFQLRILQNFERLRNKFKYYTIYNEYTIYVITESEKINNTTSGFVVRYCRTFDFNNGTIEITAWDITESFHCTKLRTKFTSLA